MRIRYEEPDIEVVLFSEIEAMTTTVGLSNQAGGNGLGEGEGGNYSDFFPITP